MSLLGGRNKFIVLINWVASYLNNNGGSRLIIRKFEREELAKKNKQTSKID